MFDIGSIWISLYGISDNSFIYFQNILSHYCTYLNQSLFLYHAKKKFLDISEECGTRDWGNPKQLLSPSLLNYLLFDKEWFLLLLVAITSCSNYYFFLLAKHFITIVILYKLLLVLYTLSIVVLASSQDMCAKICWMICKNLVWEICHHLIVHV